MKGERNMKYNWSLILTLSATFLLSACASSSSTDDEVAQAKTNFAQQNYQLAFKQIQSPAEQGDPESQYALGYMYYYGKGTPMNHVLGKEWIKKSANGGDSNAEQAYQMIVTQEQEKLTTPAANSTDSTEASDGTPATPVAIAPVAIAPVAIAPVAIAPVVTPVVAPVAPIATATDTTSAVNSGNFTVDEQAILKAHAHEYTLQLANAPSASGAKNYIQRHHLGKVAKYYSRQVNDKTTYTVIYGHYASRNAALSALHKLPTSIQKAKPWPRTMSSVQAEIRAK
ncbi:MAG: hypothetical protein EXR81_06170 [Gammaproteobacteria bacterium]|nr:hypothetical protein [Gammaproteobacteria bacterium]